MKSSADRQRTDRGHREHIPDTPLGLVEHTDQLGCDPNGVRSMCASMTDIGSCPCRTSRSSRAPRALLAPSGLSSSLGGVNHSGLQDILNFGLLMVNSVESLRPSCVAPLGRRGLR